LAEHRAAAGDPVAMCQVAGLIADGVLFDGIARETALYQKAADLGYGCGFVGLGNLYYNDFLIRDYSKALQYYRQAYRLAYPIAANNIAAVFYSKFPPDFVAANHWYAISAKQGCAEGYTGLGEAYEYGLGVGVDLRRAKSYLLVAEMAGDPESRGELDHLNSVASPLPSGRGLSGRSASSSNDSNSEYQLGRMYYWGNGVAQNKTTAFKLFLDSAKGGDGKAEVAVGRMLQLGDGTKQDEPQSIHWFEEAAANGEASAYFMLGNAYGNAEGVAQDPARAVKYYLTGASKGNQYCISALALMYRTGSAGLSADPVKAYAYSVVAGTVNQPDADEAAQLRSGLNMAQVAQAKEIIDKLLPIKHTMIPPEP
jgi:TPR repeat protein